MSAKREDKQIFSAELIMEYVLSGVIAIDTEWVIRYSNRSAAEIIGATPNEITNRPLREVFKSDLCDVSHAVKRTLDTGEELFGKYGYLVNWHGDVVPVKITTIKLYANDGNFVGVAVRFVMVTTNEECKSGFGNIVKMGEFTSRSPLMLDVFEGLPAIASSPSTILIQGETGTGKELLARTIHGLSPRRSGPFVAVNCAALPDTLLESELFGYKAGAFTGADRDKPGRFALAKGGTLFLDEIGDMPQALQVKLLRVLQEKVYEPLGSVTSESADVRIIAASNRDLYQLALANTFRNDLYYRLNIMKIELPPLRLRKEDIPIVVRQFIVRYNTMQNKSVLGVSPEALGCLMAHNWPGNVRELENIIERAFILCSDGYIENEHLPHELTMAAPRQVKSDAVHDAHTILDMQTITTALENNGYNRAAAARQLKIHKTTLFRRMKKLGITAPRRKGAETA